MELVLARLCEPARFRALCSLGLCAVLLLAGPGHLAAQDRTAGLIAASADDNWPASSEIASSTGPSPTYRLLPNDSRDHEPGIASAGLATEAPLTLGLGPQRLAGTPFTPGDAYPLWATEPASGTAPCPLDRLPSDHSSACDQRMASAALTMDDGQGPEPAEADLPRSEFLERHRLLFSILLPVVTLAAVTGDALLPYRQDNFHVNHEGWFGRNTRDGGADKASHLTDYFVIASLFEDVYRMIGYSEKEAILWSFGLAVATGLGNEINNGFTKKYGFSWEDLTMDVAGAATASLLSLTRTRDLFGMRTSHLPGDTYTHEVYSADLKLSGLARRLGVNLGPLRWLLFSVTYGSKGYRVEPPIDLQRQLGFEIGLNLQQILNDLGVKRNTWWGYPLHLLGDNVRFPFTAVGMRLDLNRGKWHGPNSGNY